MRENAATKLRNMISSPGDIILGPGVYDGFSARIALGVGFDMIYMVQASLFHALIPYPSVLMIGNRQEQEPARRELGTQISGLQI